MKLPTPAERTIMKKRPCKYCHNEIYLQYIPAVSSTIQWVSFDLDGRLHNCPVRPLSQEARQFIHNTINYTGTNTTNTTTILHRIDMITESLKELRQSVIKLYELN